MCGGGGSKNWASSFRDILGFLVVSLQFEPADARVLVEHPVPRCPSCMPVLFGIHVNSPPPPPHFSNTDPLCIAPTQVCVCVRGVGGVKIGQSFFTKTTSNTIEVDLF